MSIHPTAIVEPGAQLGADCEIMAHAVVTVDDGGISFFLHDPDVGVSVERPDPEALDIVGYPNDPMRIESEELRRGDRIGNDPGMRLTKSRRRQYPLDEHVQLLGIDTCTAV